MYRSNLWPRGSRSGRLQRELCGTELIGIKICPSPSSTTSLVLASAPGARSRPRRLCHRRTEARAGLESQRVTRDKVGAAIRLLYSWGRGVEAQSRINMAGFILKDERLRFDSAGANDGRLEAISGLRTHQNDGYAGEQEQAAHKYPVEIRSFKLLHHA